MKRFIIFFTVIILCASMVYAEDINQIQQSINSEMSNKGFGLYDSEVGDSDNHYMYSLTYTNGESDAIIFYHIFTDPNYNPLEFKKLDIGNYKEAKINNIDGLKKPDKWYWFAYPQNDIWIEIGVPEGYKLSDFVKEY